MQASNFFFIQILFVNILLKGLIHVNCECQRLIAAMQDVISHHNSVLLIYAMQLCFLCFYILITLLEA